MRDEIVALRYVAVSVVTAAEGESVYAFVFHLRTSTGAVFALSARYSALRALSSRLAAEQPAACASLPRFPPKQSLSRQTPQFLLARGRALEAYLPSFFTYPHTCRRRLYSLLVVIAASTLASSHPQPRR